jgi:hypothetical protein
MNTEELRRLLLGSEQTAKTQHSQTAAEVLKKGLDFPNMLPRQTRASRPATFSSRDHFQLSAFLRDLRASAVNFPATVHPPKDSVRGPLERIRRNLFLC